MATALTGSTRHTLELPAFEIRDIGSLEEQLQRLSRDANDPADPFPPHMVRQSTLTLIALCSQSFELSHTRKAIQQLRSWRPSRVVLIAPHVRGRPRITAQLTIDWERIADGGDDRTASYVEEITLHVYGPATRHLVSIMRPLLLPDLPAALWFAGDPSLQTWFTQDIVQLADVLFIDPHRYRDPRLVFNTLFESRQLYRNKTLVDLSWMRVRPWRFSIARAFNLPEIHAALSSLSEIELHIETPNAEAYLTLGWILSSVNLTPRAVSGLPIPRIEFKDCPYPGVQAKLVFLFDDPGRSRIEIVESESSLATTVTNSDTVLHVGILPKYRVATVAAIGDALQSAPSDSDTYRNALEGAAHLSLRRGGIS